MRYLDDFKVGERFAGAGRIRADAASIKRFAREFDPQRFHLEEDAAKRSIFQGLVASGWHTTAMTMRLLVESDFKPAGGIVGASFEELRWPRPVREGDELHVEVEVLAVTPSTSRPERGFLKVRTITRNQDGQPVLEMVGNLLVPRRPTTAGSPGGPQTF